jgi:RNA polymerase sigma-70 factor, ECF subfamily
MNHFEETRPDHEHMAELLAGSAEAWAELYTRHYSGLVRFCGNFTSNSQQAQDFAQETLIRLKLKAAQFKAGAELKPWLYKIARNICLVNIRKKHEVGWSDSVFAATICAIVDSAPSPSTQVGNLQLNRQALNALAELSEEQRTVLMLKYVEGLTRQQIADAMDIPLATVKSRLYYAMNAVREKFPTNI